MNLLLPVAGMSTRFPNMKPKWLLTSPNGNLMIIEAILGLELSHFNKIYIITINDHLLEFDFIDGIKNQFSQIGYLDKLEFIILDEKTKSQPETIAKAIIQKGIKGGIYIKDSFIEKGRVNSAAMRYVARMGYSEYTTVSSKFKMKIHKQISRHHSPWSINTKNKMLLIHSQGIKNNSQCSYHSKYERFRNHIN